MSYDDVVANQNDEHVIALWVVIDVREEAEVSAVAFEGAYNLSLTNLVSDLASVPFEMPTTD
jgi:hypothetical protein